METITYKGNTASVRGTAYKLNANVLKAWGVSQDVISTGLAAKMTWPEVLEGWRKAGNEIALLASNPVPQTQPVAPIPQASRGPETPEQELLRLRAENERLKASRNQLTLKVSEKGALSIYGFGRFPVTLYREQWEKLFAMSKTVLDFIAANSASLKRKEDKAS